MGIAAACMEVDGVRGVEACDTAKAAPYFFLSYARSPWAGQGGSQRPDVWQVKFFEDLCDRIGRLSDLSEEAAKYAGFMDTEQWVGPNKWPTRLAQALATCRVFVPLFSRRYFESEDCGKEWFAFTRRALNSAARGRGAAEAIIPALWDPVDARYLPEVARSIHFNHPDLGESYAANGFYGLIKLSKYRDVYTSAVDGLARLVVRAAGESPVAPEPVTDYASLVSTFGSEVRSMPGGQPLRITIVAPRQGELPSERNTLYYGHDACGWNPYAPDAVRGLADHAADLARGLGYRPDIGDLDQHGHELLRSGPPSSPEVLIVDAWATTIDKYASLLKRLDAMNKPWVQVVVPWKRGDADDEAAKRKLRLALVSALGHKLADGRAISSSAVRGVPTLDDFSQVLPTVIMTAARQYLRHARPFPPAGYPEMERPRLSLSLSDPSNTELLGA
jgi:FxsC-like protein